MHEMTLALNIIDIASATAKTEKANKINQIEIEVGQLAGVFTDSLEFCFEAASKNTLVDGARLLIIDIPGKGVCQDCEKEFFLDSYFFPCPTCGRFVVDIIQGKELKIRSINID